MAAINHPLGGVGRALPFRRPRINGWILGGMLIAGVGAMLPVLETSLATTRGFNNQTLTAESVQLQGDIRELEAQVANFTSLQRIERRALSLGMVAATEPIYVEISEPGPEPAKVPAGYLPVATPVLAEPESWWESLFGWLPLLD
jgi:hypothetical protein